MLGKSNNGNDVYALSGYSPSSAFMIITFVQRTARNEVLVQHMQFFSDESLSNNALIRGKKLKCIEERYSPRRKLLKTCQGSIYADKGHLVSFLNVSIPTEMASVLE
ncbi:hypothetical protein MtrunA17_Chr6g0479531 [Medicago truncatula]|uniref:Uncharacterized protein n=1 Tax=Medicago truncatula TaxID=3880 RepID=A0A396HIA6_MEDTR|nr:hypothetical protein MtrunA17_Chr6g0479531 [Medicago truncatula]